MLEKIKDIYTESIQTQIAVSKLLATKIAEATQHIVNCLLKGNKIIVCGHGRSYANAQFLVANLINRYELVRPSFPAVLLSLDSAVGSAIISEDYNRHTLYQRQFNAIAQQGDLLIIFSPLGNEATILDVLQCALNKDVQLIVLTGENNGHIQGFLTENDLEISVPANKESRILENHLLMINTLCELIDYSLFSHS